MSAVMAMKSAGLPTDVETAYRKLEEIANERGPGDTRHFGRLLERLSLKWNPEVIAAGVVAYRATSPIYLTPFPDSVPTLLKLRDAGYKLGVASKGRAVKQWQKLIQLGLEHMFHPVTISEETESETLTVKTLSKTLEKLSVRPGAGGIRSDLRNEIAMVNRAKMVSVRVKNCTARTTSPANPNEKPVYGIGGLSDLFQMLERTD